jgi:hypothetical protein
VPLAISPICAMQTKAPAGAGAVIWGKERRCGRHLPIIAAKACDRVNPRARADPGGRPAGQKFNALGERYVSRPAIVYSG